MLRIWSNQHHIPLKCHYCWQVRTKPLFWKGFEMFWLFTYTYYWHCCMIMVLFKFVFVDASLSHIKFTGNILFYYRYLNAIHFWQFGNNNNGKNRYCLTKISKINNYSNETLCLFFEMSRTYFKTSSYFTHMYE